MLIEAFPNNGTELQHFSISRPIVSNDAELVQ